jgi:hypothetical protein
MMHYSASAIQAGFSTPSDTDSAGGIIHELTDTAPEVQVMGAFG